MRRHELTDEQWALVEPLVPRSTARTGRPARDRRTLLNGIFWILATGAPPGAASRRAGMRNALKWPSTTASVWHVWSVKNAAPGCCARPLAPTARTARVPSRSVTLSQTLAQQPDRHAAGAHGHLQRTREIRTIYRWNTRRVVHGIRYYRADAERLDSSRTTEAIISRLFYCSGSARLAVGLIATMSPGSVCQLTSPGVCLPG